MNLRSTTAPIQVMLINRQSDSTVPLVFPVPPTDELCQMPTPPSTPASLQRLPPSAPMYSTSTSCTTSSYSSSSYCSQDSVLSDQQMVLPDHDVMLTPSSTVSDLQMGKEDSKLAKH